jgi:UDP-glucose 4-epimerase
MKVLVTGGAGFIGSHVSEMLLDRGFKVVVVDNMTGGYPENVPLKARLYVADCEDVRYMKIIFENEKPDYVFHLAAYAAEGLSHFIRRFNYVNNLMASVNIINLSVLHKVKHLVFTGSMSSYGGQTPPFTEDMPYHPEDPYAISKQAVEQDIKCAHEMWGLNYTIFRPHNVYGPKQNIYDFYRNVIGIFIYQALHDMPLTIFGAGSQIRAFSHIKDIATPIVASIDDNNFLNETFNIGGDTPYTILQLAETIKEVVREVDNKEVVFDFQPPRFEVHVAYSNHDKLRKFYNYRSNICLKEGITEMYKWAKEQPNRLLFTWPKEHIEIMEKIPPKWRKALK